MGINRKSRNLRAKAWAALALLLTASACSSRLFSNGPDQSVLNQPDYRPFNAACSGISLSKSTLDVPTFKRLVNCFNSNGSIQPIANLVAKMSDAEIGVVTDTLNRHFLQDDTAIFKLERSFGDLDQAKQLDPAFTSLGKWLENDDLVVATLSLLKDAWVPGSYVLESLEYLGNQATYDRFATALNVAQNLTGSPVAGLAPAQPLVGIQSRLLSDMPEGLSYQAGETCANGNGLQTLTDCFSSFARDAQDPLHVQLARQLVNHAASGDLLPAMDLWLGSDSASLATGVPPAAALVDVVSASGGQILDGLTSLFHYLDVPITIMGGAGVTPDADIYVFEQVVDRPVSEASEFVRRTNKLTLSLFAPFSAYPDALGQYYPALSALGSSDAIDNTSVLFKALYDSTQVNGGPLVKLFVDTIGDTGGAPSVDPQSDGPENTVGVKFLVPFMAELSNRQAWGDLLLAQALLKPEDRPTLTAFLNWLTAPAASLGNQGMYDVLAGALTRASPSTLFQLAYSLRHYWGASAPVVAPALDQLRSAFYINDAHPVYDTFRSILEESSSNQGLFQLLIRLNGLPEFRDAVRFTSQIAENGNLKSIAYAMVSLFHPFAEQGAVAVSATQAPQLIDGRRHNLSFAMLTPHVTVPYTGEAAGYADCSALDTRINLLDYQAPGFNSQLQAWEGCLNAGGDYTDLTSSLQFLQQNPVPGRSENFLDLALDEIQGIKDAMTVAAAQSVIESFLSGYAAGTVAKDAQVLPLFVTTAVSVPGQTAGPVLQAGLDAANAAYGLASAQFGRLWQFAKAVAARSDLADVTRFLGTVWTQASGPVPPPAPDTSVNVPNLGPVPSWIENAECEGDSSVATIADPAARKQAEIDCLVSRVDRMLGNHECEKIPTQASELAERSRVFNDYFNEITSWDLIDGGVRTSWNFGEFKALLDPLLNRMANFSQSVPGKPVLEAPFTVLHYFTLAPGEQPGVYAHYTPLQFMQWLKDKSSDAKVISYYYPAFGSGCPVTGDTGPSGNDEDPRCPFDTEPRVRLVSTLDRLELVLINADFMSPLGFPPSDPLEKLYPEIVKQNDSYYFLELLANAWGDEPESLWPTQIQALAATNRKSDPNWQPMKLQDVADQMNKMLRDLSTLVGYTTPPKCTETADSEDPESVQQYETAAPGGPGLVGWLPLPDLAGMRARLYNLIQVSGVMNDIMPKKDPTTGQWTGDPGARVLRDLFFELFYSTPTQYQNPFEDCDQLQGQQFTGNICHNNLWATMRLARLGILHQAARLLRSIPDDDQSLQDFFDTMLSAVRGNQPAGAGGVNPTLENALNGLMVTDSRHGLFWGVEQKLFGIVDAASGVPTAELDAEHQAELAGLDPAAQAAVRAGWVQELARLKQLVYYFIATLEPNHLTLDAVGTAAPVLDQDTSYLTGQVDAIRSLLRSPVPAGALLALYGVDDPAGRTAADQVLDQFLAPRQADGLSLGNDAVQSLVTISGNAQASALLSLVQARLQGLQTLPGYQSLGFPAGSTVIQSLLNFLESDDPTETALRNFALARFEAGDLDAVLGLEYQQPDAFYSFLTAFANHVTNGDINTALAIMDAALVSAESSP